MQIGLIAVYLCRSIHCAKSFPHILFSIFSLTRCRSLSKDPLVDRRLSQGEKSLGLHPPSSSIILSAISTAPIPSSLSRNREAWELNSRHLDGSATPCSCSSQSSFSSLSISAQLCLSMSFIQFCLVSHIKAVLPPKTNGHRCDTGQQEFNGICPNSALSFLSPTQRIQEI
jgi:hypothetical protein